MKVCLRREAGSTIGFFLCKIYGRNKNMRFKEAVKKILGKNLLSLYHFKLALLGAFLYGFAGKSKALKIIGVTGTSGKSTTSDFLSRILEEAGNKVASVSTIRFKIGEKEWENKYKMTMPGRFVMQKFLRQAKNAGCKFVVLEVTSEGIRQFRHKFINFDTAVFTNLGQEHIERHGGFENYRNAKLELFYATKNVHVINADDPNAEYFVKVPAKKIIKFTLDDAKKMDLKLQVPGEFNLYNAMAAISVAKVYGIGLADCKKTLENAKGIAGRMEVVQEKPFKVIVDYAHTPEQLESVYKTLQNPKTQGPTPKLVCVLGSCGGGRDKWKRPVLGKIANQYCDKIIITNEDPYDENAMEIINQVAEPTENKAEKILDRREAIKKAIDLAKPGNIVIITGKGSEPWMCLAGGKKIPWDDRQTAREALKNKT